jgi:hypothetical protein
MMTCFVLGAGYARIWPVRPRELALIWTSSSRTRSFYLTPHRNSALTGHAETLGGCFTVRTNATRVPSRTPIGTLIGPPLTRTFRARG